MQNIYLLSDKKKKCILSIPYLHKKVRFSLMSYFFIITLFENIIIFLVLYLMNKYFVFSSDASNIKSILFFNFLAWLITTNIYHFHIYDFYKECFLGNKIKESTDIFLEDDYKKDIVLSKIMFLIFFMSSFLVQFLVFYYKIGNKYILYYFLIILLLALIIFLFMYLNIMFIKNKFKKVNLIEIFLKNGDVKSIKLDDTKSISSYYDGSIICRTINDDNYDRIFVSSIKEIKLF